MKTNFLPASPHRTLAETPWSIPSGVPFLPEGEVHIWRANLVGDSVQCRQMMGILSEEEHDRAARFHYDSDRTNYSMARGILRQLLGVYLGAPPETVRFAYSAYNKPFLSDQEDLQFNISHAGGYGLFAFCRGIPVGIDLEVCDSEIEVDRLSSRFFSAVEAEQVLAYPASDQYMAFFQSWTRKEAFIKAHGAGLSLPLDQFVVTAGSKLPTEVLQIDWAPETVADWSLFSFEVTPVLPAAVALEGQVRTLRFFDWVV